MTMEHLPFEDVQYFLLKMETFQCHVSFQGGKCEKSKHFYASLGKISNVPDIFLGKLEKTPGFFLGILRVFSPRNKGPQKILLEIG